jgi:hypothetical protein
VLLEAEVGQGNAGGPEGAGLDDVAAGGEVGGVDTTNGIRLRERQDVDAVLEIAVVVGKPLAAEAPLVERQGVHHRAHRPIEHEDPPVKERAQQVVTRGVRSGHAESRLGQIGETRAGLPARRPDQPLSAAS